MATPIRRVLVFGKYYRCAPPDHLGYVDIRGIWSVSCPWRNDAFSEHIDKVFVKLGFPAGSYLKDVYDYAWAEDKLDYAIDMANDHACTFDWLTDPLTPEQLKPRDLAEFVARHRRDL